MSYTLNCPVRYQQLWSPCRRLYRSMGMTYTPSTCLHYCWVPRNTTIMLWILWTWPSASTPAISSKTHYAISVTVWKCWWIGKGNQSMAEHMAFLKFACSFCLCFWLQVVVPYSQHSPLHGVGWPTLLVAKHTITRIPTDLWCHI